MTNALAKTAVVAVIGAGVMGRGIAQLAAQHGHQVLLYDVDAALPAAACADVEKTLVRLVEKGKYTATDADAIIRRIVPVTALTDIATAALVIEAVIERLDVKQQLFTELEVLCGPDTVFASNTSTLSITAIAAALKTPSRLVGMHFFNPAPVMRLVEVICGHDANAAVVACVRDTAVAWGKQVVTAQSTPGFIVNRIARPYYNEALRTVEANAADPATVDAIMTESAGFRMGPLALLDLIGLDVHLRNSVQMQAAFFGDMRFQPSQYQQQLVDAGRYGRKTGAGIYNYADALPLPHTVPPCAPPQLLVLPAEGPLAPLTVRATARGVSYTTHEHPWISAGNSRIALTDGQPATAHAIDNGFDNYLLCDLTFDYEKAVRIALARAAQCNDNAYADAVGAFQALGFAVSVIDDIPGMIAMRTVAMLVNIAVDAVAHGVCSEADADDAMCYGANYPFGPIAWGKRIGTARINACLHNLHQWYGDGHYRPAVALRRQALIAS